jgi:ribonucleotide monophosphatase NagD (HAD superfamily)
LAIHSNTSSIDGVLLRSSSILAGAHKALKYLHDHGIPFILLTNGGGKLESVRVKELSDKLGVPLTIENFVQSHTPFQEMAKGSENYEALANKTIFVTGSDQDKAREIAEACVGPFIMRIFG